MHRGSVHDHAVIVQRCTPDHGLFGIGGVDARGVACTTVLKHQARHLNGLVHARHHHAAQDGREFFFQQHMARLRLGDGAHQRLAVDGHLHACGLGDFVCRATHHFAVELATGKGVILDLQ